MRGERLLYGSGSNVIWRPVASLTEGGEKAEEIFCWRGELLEGRHVIHWAQGM